jgi:ferredoxin
MESLGVRNIRDFVIKSEGHGETAINRTVGGARALLTDHRTSLGPRLFGRLQVAADQFGSVLKRNLKTDSVALYDLAAKELADAQTLFDSIPNNDLRACVSDVFAEIYDKVVNFAGGLNTPTIVDRTTKDPRYAAQKNRAVPKKIGSQLYLYDCINCDKCVPVCPNDANFVYEVDPVDVVYQNYLLGENRIEQVEGGRFKIAKSHQLANFADFCNECGNCDVFCPEDGGPYIEKPRFFGTVETYERHNTHDGCVVSREGTKDFVRGRISGRELRLTLDHLTDTVTFSDNVLEVEFDHSTCENHRITVLDPGSIGHVLDMKNYYVLETLRRGVLNQTRVNYINVPHINFSNSTAASD